MIRPLSLLLFWSTCNDFVGLHTRRQIYAIEPDFFDNLISQIWNIYSFVRFFPKIFEICPIIISGRIEISWKIKKKYRTFVRNFTFVKKNVQMFFAMNKSQREQRYYLQLFLWSLKKSNDILWSVKLSVRRYFVSIRILLDIGACKCSSAVLYFYGRLKSRSGMDIDQLQRFPVKRRQEKSWWIFYY